MTYAECAAAAARVLAAAGITPDDSRRDAALLSRTALDWPLETWLARQHDQVPAGWPDRLAPLVRRRAAREPMAYITGRREFYGRTFRVTPAVLIPRPETELLIEAALERLGPACGAGAPHGPLVADIGTGSGCLAITLALECPSARLIASDVSREALAVAAENAAALGASDRLELREGALLAGACPPLDLIVSNPPYIRDGDRRALPPEVRDHEPAAALFAGPEGLDVIRAVLAVGVQALRPGGWVLIEIGAGQADAARQAARAHAELSVEDVLPDLQRIPRALVCRRRQVAA